jgi:hypothetical protein
LSWQQEFISDAYDNPNGPTQRAILNFGRKNGKTALAAARDAALALGRGGVWAARGRDHGGGCGRAS